MDIQRMVDLEGAYCSVTSEMYFLKRVLLPVAILRLNENVNLLDDESQGAVLRLYRAKTLASGPGKNGLESASGSNQTATSSLVTEP